MRCPPLFREEFRIAINHLLRNVKNLDPSLETVGPGPAADELSALRNVVSDSVHPTRAAEDHLIAEADALAVIGSPLLVDRGRIQEVEVFSRRLNFEREGLQVSLQPSP